MAFVRSGLALLVISVSNLAPLSYAFSLRGTSIFKMAGEQGGIVGCELEHPVKDLDAGMDSASRRSLLLSTVAAAFASTVAVDPSYAATDCFSDCLKNCKLIAPKDPQYCQNNCQDYCAQEDRTDGLSGSKSSSGGEVGILGTSTVVKGEDKPPQIKIPGLDFTSDKGKQLIGY